MGTTDPASGIQRGDLAESVRLGASVQEGSGLHLPRCGGLRPPTSLHATLHGLVSLPVPALVEDGALVDHGVRVLEGSVDAPPPGASGTMNEAEAQVCESFALVILVIVLK